MKQQKKDIILVDDHVIIRNGLAELIGKLGNYNVSRQYDNGRQFVDALPLSPMPDLVVMDITMPEMDGDEVMEILNERRMDLPVLILTLSQDENRLVRLFRQGVRGYLKKDCTAATMKEALEEILNYGFYHNELLTHALRSSKTFPQKSAEEEILEKLSAREREFLKHVCDEQEYTYDQIADMMYVQHRTVDGYRQSIFEKFGIKSKTGLVLWVLKHNLLQKL